jgi:uncharacterized protein (DUF1800 family)
LDTETKIDPQWAWDAYRPSREAPWDLRRAGHLYRRAAFGATYTELQAALKAGPEETIAKLLAGGWDQWDFDRKPEVVNTAESIAKTNNDGQLGPWWLLRMLRSPHPLQEKMTLFWHNHFATSNAKVQNARFMLDEYELLRKHALGSFGPLLQSISRDPAMMVWLDTKGSTKGNPNENYARELMELFSLGIGHYTEKDIREAARAFTGWDIVGAEPVYRKDQHDAGDKTVIGRTGKWKGEDVIRICLEHEAMPLFIARKLFRSLVSETVLASKELIEPLALQFRKTNLDIGALVQTILSSNLFFSPAAYRTCVKSPVEFALGIIRGLEGDMGTTALNAALGQLGQHLFHPPSVKGWDGGATWLNGQTLLFRQNLAMALTSTEDPRFGSRTDPARVLEKHEKTEDDEVLDYFLRVFLQDDLPAESRQRLKDYQVRSQNQTVPKYWKPEDATKHRVRALCHLVLTLPEFQLA